MKDIFKLIFLMGSAKKILHYFEFGLYQAHTNLARPSPENGLIWACSATGVMNPLISPDAYDK